MAAHRQSIEIDRPPAPPAQVVQRVSDHDLRTASERQQAAGRAYAAAGMYSAASLLAVVEARPRRPRMPTAPGAVHGVLTRAVKAANDSRRRAWSTTRGRG